MVTTAVKKSLNKLKFYREIELPDFASKGQIPIRHLEIGFNGKEIDTNFFMQNRFATTFFYTLSVFLTYGEDLVIQTARHHRDLVTDPVLKNRVTSLIGQEAIHSKIHNEFNDALIATQYPVELYRTLGEWFFENVFERFPQPLKLSLMAGIEHFTAVLSEFMMKHEEYFYHTEDAKTRAMWMWHMLEESEHKDIAYDVYQLLNGSYPLRVAGFGLAFGTIFGLVPTMGLFVPFFQKPKDMLTSKFWTDAKRGFSLVWGPKAGVFGSTWGQVFDYLRTDFHPNDHDTTQYLQYYKEKLLAADGSIGPYLTKEFTPPLRAA
jgi:predicted metal-dependent hydrolase